MDDKQTRLMTILAVVLVGLVLVIRFVEPPSDEDEVDGPELVDLVELELEDVKTLSLTSEVGQVRAEKTMSGWLLTEPEDARGNDEALNEVIETVARLQVEAAMEGADPSKYGFDEPAAVLVLSTASGEHTFEIGMESPVGFKTYVRLDGGDVQVASGRPMRSLVRPTEAFRDRGVHAVAAPLLDGVRWSPAEGEGWSVERRADGWWLADGRRASDAEIQGLIAAIDALNYEAFYPERGDDEFPSQLALRDATGEAVFGFGGLVGGGVLLRGPDGTVGTIGSYETLHPPVESLVETRLLATSPAWLSELHVSIDGAGATWTKGEEGWLRDDTPDAAAMPSVLVLELIADRRVVLEPFTEESGRVRASGNGQLVEVVLGPVTNGGRLGSENGGPSFLVPQASLDRLASAVQTGP